MFYNVWGPHIPGIPRLFLVFFGQCLRGDKVMIKSGVSGIFDGDFIELVGIWWDLMAIWFIGISSDFMEIRFIGISWDSLDMWRGFHGIYTRGISFHGIQWDSILNRSGNISSNYGLKNGRNAFVLVLTCPRVKPLDNSINHCKWYNYGETLDACEILHSQKDRFSSLSIWDVYHLSTLNLFFPDLSTILIIFCGQNNDTPPIRLGAHAKQEAPF